MVSIPEFLTTAQRHLFFTGKGGVGKTSFAYASAVLLADEEARTLGKHLSGIEPRRCFWHEACE